MNDPQFWGAVRGVLIALGGAVATLGVMSAAEWTALVNQVLSVAMAVAGLIAIVWPMYQGYKSRSRKALIETTAEQPGVQRIVTDPATAAAVPSAKVVSQPGF
jgi:hypothetical protein